MNESAIASPGTGEVRPRSVEYRTLTERTAFIRLAGSWDALVLAAQRPSPFLLHGWLDQWWKHHGEQTRMWVEAAFVDGELVAALPLELTRPLPGVRAASFMGRTHAILGDVLVQPAFEQSVVPALLARAAAAGVDYVDFFGVPQPSVIGRSASARKLPAYERLAAPVLDLAAGWDVVYKEKTSSKRRNLHRRRRRQLEELGQVEITVHRTAEELAAVLDDAFVLHDLRWSGRRDGSEFTTPVGRRFNQDVTEALAADDVARILMLRIDGKPAAFLYYFMLASRMYVYRLAFDPALSKYSPGVLTTLAAIEAAAGEGAQRVEYLGGDERYKVELSDGTESLVQRLGLARNLRGRAAIAVAVGALNLRLRLKRSERLHAVYLNGLGSLRQKAARSE